MTTRREHLPGDKLHPVDDETTSVNSILLNLRRMCSLHALPPYWEIWPDAYPEDPMAVKRAGQIVKTAMDYTPYHGPLIPDNRADIVMDLRAAGWNELADTFTRMLEDRGYFV